MTTLEKYQRRVKQVNSLVCVGLDSATAALPARFRELTHPQFEFNKWIIDQTVNFTAAFKPNFAFYEANMNEGWTDLQLTMEYLHDRYPKVVTIADAKRADIDSTNAGYVAAIYEQLGFDAVTLHPYLGREALAPFLSYPEKLAFVLCRTSNTGAGEFQDLLVDGEPLWSAVATRVSQSWAKQSDCGLVVGATYPEELRRIRAIAPDTLFLVPGVGAQGGSVEAVMTVGLDAHKAGLLISASRSIIFADDPAGAAQALCEEINRYR